MSPATESDPLARIEAALIVDEAAEDRQRALIEASRDQLAPLPSNARNGLRIQINQVGRSNDLDLIIECESRLLTYELKNYVVTPSQESSIKNALADLEIAAVLIDKVRDPETYQPIASGYLRGENRVDGLPKDEAIQFFASHITRLSNAERAMGRGDRSEKQLLDARRSNIREARKLYKALQKRALGVS